MCNFVKWPGIMTNGGFAEYVLVDSYRFWLMYKKAKIVIIMKNMKAAAS